MASKIVESKSKVTKPTISEKLIELYSDIDSSLNILSVGEVKYEPQGTDNFRRSYPDITSNPSIIRVARSVFQPGKTYRFRMVRSATLTSSGAGAFSLKTDVYPSQFDQYAGLSLIFDEARLVATRVRVVRNQSPSLQTAIATAFDPSGNASTFTQTNGIPGCIMYTTNQTNWPVKASWKTRTPRPWSIVSATPSGTDPVGGIIGSWSWSAASTTDNTTVLFTYRIEVDYEFRNPA
jgi:hypothetical protein